MKKLIVAVISAYCLLVSAAKTVLADVPVADASGQIRRENPKLITFDSRVISLRKFLNRYNSPLAPYAEEFVAQADKYQLDWRLLAAISGIESTFGKQIPYNSFNAYGWAGGKFRFKSWEDSIAIVSRSLREEYIDKGASTLSQISRRYCPPNPNWGFKVQYFMNKIDPLGLVFSLEV